MSLWVTKKDETNASVCKHFVFMESDLERTTIKSKM